MGRHSKPPVRRGSFVTLTSLVPAGIVAVSTASVAEVNTGEFAALTPPQDVTGDQQAAPPAPSGPLTDADVTLRVATTPGKPTVKSNMLAADRTAVTVAEGPGGMPGVAYRAYRNAERVLAQEEPDCNMSWSLLAGIGQVESHHGFGRIDADGYPLRPVYGPVLNGSLGGNSVVRETDGGELDGESGYARAVGPMQFLPDTFRRYAADGKGDGTADPQNIFDAALTAGKYLCTGGLDMNDPAQQTRAIMRYNHSMAYVANVMGWQSRYRADEQRDNAAHNPPAPQVNQPQMVSAVDRM